MKDLDHYSLAKIATVIGPIGVATIAKETKLHAATIRKVKALNTAVSAQTLITLTAYVKQFEYDSNCQEKELCRARHSYAKAV